MPSDAEPKSQGDHDSGYGKPYGRINWHPCQLIWIFVVCLGPFGDGFWRLVEDVRRQYHDGSGLFDVRTGYQGCGLRRWYIYAMRDHGIGVGLCRPQGATTEPLSR